VEIRELFIIIISSVAINNIVLSRLLGIRSFQDVSKNADSALGTGMAVSFALVATTAITWLADHYLIKPGSSHLWRLITDRVTPPGITALRTIVFIVVILGVVKLIDGIIGKTSPALKKSLGLYLTPIATNGIILIVALLNLSPEFYDTGNFLRSLIHSLAAGAGFTIVVILMAGILERLELAPVPKLLRGAPVALILAGLMGIAFLGFVGLKI